MRKSPKLFSPRRVGILAATALLATAAASAWADPPVPGYQLRFSSTFMGNTLDPLKWNTNFPWAQTTPGSSTWVQPQNVSVNNNALSITATNQSTGGQAYTSGAINTSGLLNFTYGYVEARMEMPQTLGAWPAFWMLQNGWPPEIDVEESPFPSYGSMYNYDATYHWGTSGSPQSAGSGSYYTGVNTTTSFNNYGALWTPQGITFYFNGNPVSFVSSSSANIAQAQHMYLIMNLAIGGWPGNPPSWASFPTSLQAQWVKVWQLPSAPNQTMNWTVGGYGYWDNASSWTGGVPKLGSQTAYFGAVNSSWAWAAWNGSRTVGNLIFNSNTGYTIGNQNTTNLILASDTGTSNITAQVYNGTQPNAPWIDTRLELYNNVNINNYLNSHFVINGDIVGSGTLSVNNGGVDIHGTVTSTGDVNVDNNGSIDVYGTINTPNNNINLTTAPGSAAAMTVENGASISANVIRVGGFNGGTALYTQPGGTVNAGTWFVLGQSGAATGTADISGGTLNVRTASTTQGDLEVGVYNNASGTINISGGNVNLFNNANMVLGSRGTTGNGTVNQTGGTVTFYSDGGSTVGGAGQVILGRLGSTGTYTYNLNGGTLITGSITGGSGTSAFTFNGGTLAATQSNSAFMTAVTSVTLNSAGGFINNNSHDITLNQNIGGTGGLTSYGAGTLSLPDYNSFGGPLTLDSGAVQIGGNTTAAGGATVDNSTLTVSGTFNAAVNDINVANVPSDAGALVVQGHAVVEANTIRIGGNNGGVGAFTQTGGTTDANHWFVIGESGGANGTAAISGGALNVRTTAGTQGDLEVGVFNAAAGALNISGGTVNLLNNANLIAGSQGTTGNGTITQTGGTVAFYADAGATTGGTGQVILGRNASTGTYTYNLDGGTLLTNGVTHSSGTANFNFNGGTLAATQDNAAFMTGLNAVTLGAAGGIINNNGHAIAINQTIGGPGGLTVEGAGMVTLSGLNQFTGPLTVVGGTLNLAGPAGSVTSISALNLAPGATLNLNNTALMIHYGSAASPLGAIGSYIADGQLTSSTAASSGGVYALGYADGASGAVSGLSAGNVLVKMVLAGDADMDGQVNFNDFLILESHFGKSAMQWTQGDFSHDGVVNFQDFLTLESNFGKSVPGAQAVVVTGAQLAAIAAFGRQIGAPVAVPEPATLALLAVGGLVLLKRRRRAA